MHLQVVQSISALVGDDLESLENILKSKDRDEGDQTNMIHFSLGVWSQHLPRKERKTFRI